jgi:SP family arabinose:H+ symporter-like MFS transporter
MNTRQNQIFYKYLVSIAAAMGGLMFGFDIAIISGTVPFIQEHFALSDLALGWGVSSLLAGCMVGALLAGKISDRLGRRRTLLSVAILFAGTSLMTALAGNFTIFVTARILGGLAVGASSILSPLYIAEISPPADRGRLVAFNQLAITLGILASYLINYLFHDIGDDNWRCMFATGVLPSMIFFSLLCLAPESPRWLYQHGRIEEARSILTRIGGKTAAAQEIQAMKKAQRIETTPSGFSLLRPEYRRLALVGVVLSILVQTSGINTIIDYAPIILKSAGNSIDVALFQTFIIGFINFGFTFVAIFTIDRIGRKPLYLIGACGMAVSLILLSAAFYLGHATGYVGLALILMFIAFFSACIGPVFWVLVSEIFPTKVRGAAMSLTVFTNWAANATVVLFFPHVLKQFGGGTTFGFLALMSVFMAVFTWVVIPETKERSLEDIETLWADRPGSSGH